MPADQLMSLPLTARMTRDERAAFEIQRAKAAAPDLPWCDRCRRPVDRVTFTVADTPSLMIVAAECHGATATRTVRLREAGQGAIAVLGAELFGPAGR